MEERIEEVLEVVRPRLAMHKGNVSFVKFDEATGEVHLRLEGSCDGCPLASLTLHAGIEMLLKERIPEVTGVVQVTA